MEVTASLNRYRQAPRKVRLLADLVRGKKVDDAIAELTFLPKRASGELVKLLKSAEANAVNNFKLPKEGLYIKEIRVDGGKVMKRGMPRAFGRSFQILKRTSHINLVLGVKEDKKEMAKKIIKKIVKKAKVKK